MEEKKVLSEEELMGITGGSAIDTSAKESVEEMIELGIDAAENELKHKAHKMVSENWNDCRSGSAKLRG